MKISANTIPEEQYNGNCKKNNNTRRDERDTSRVLSWLASTTAPMSMFLSRLCPRRRCCRREIGDRVGMQYYGENFHFGGRKRSGGEKYKTNQIPFPSFSQKKPDQGGKIQHQSDFISLLLPKKKNLRSDWGQYNKSHIPFPYFPFKEIEEKTSDQVGKKQSELDPIPLFPLQRQNLRSDWDRAISHSTTPPFPSPPPIPKK